MKRLVCLLAGTMFLGCGDTTQEGALLTPNGIITGSVVDALGNGLAYEVVSICRPCEVEPLGTTTTDADGRFRFDSVPLGNEYVVNAGMPLGQQYGKFGRKHHVLVRAGEVTDVGTIEQSIIVPWANERLKVEVLGGPGRRFPFHSAADPLRMSLISEMEGSQAPTCIDSASTRR